MEWFWRWSRSTFWLVNPLFLLETFLLHTLPSILSSQGILVNFSLCSIKPLLFTVWAWWFFNFCILLFYAQCWCSIFFLPSMSWRTAYVQCILSNGSRSVIEILLSYAQCWCSIFFFAFNVLKNSFCPVHLEQWQRICDWHPPLVCTMLVLNLFFCLQCLEEQLLSSSSWAMAADLWLTFDGKEKRSYLKRSGIESDTEIENSSHSVYCYLWIHALDVQCYLPPISISFVYVCIMSADNQTTIGWWWAVYMRKGWCLDMAGDMT